MTTYITEGRRFDTALHAVAFARGLAAEYDRSVDVQVETKDFLGRIRRSWMCRMHPHGVKRTALNNHTLPLAVGG